MDNGQSGTWTVGFSGENNWYSTVAAWTVGFSGENDSDIAAKDAGLRKVFKTAIVFFWFGQNAHCVGHWRVGIVGLDWMLKK